ncbi:LysR family substrate-binding domain-containing protein [Nocardia sp. CA2R105]|uniref:LysR family substrate-binding domain-containing protein n=1 Tax=Nocardia coffeae TaxID=2873381 RepID=UPI001CA5FD84|nr:LysR family substrate-binding domain-containing protein [Nocardia coffeae]MBY8859666.1 LysR family substrate-binding domain-containing protein [Nocardia coffeae]
MNECAPDALRVGYVPGVTVAKWARIWSERFADDSLAVIGIPQSQQESALRDGAVDMCFVRLPIDREGMHAIPLYHELPVVVVPKDHPIALFEEVATTDLTDERMQDADDLDALSGTLELVAAVGGAAIMPHSLARLHHRKDLVYRTVTDLPPTEIALAWPIDLDNPAVEDFIGVVRGRTARSTRGQQEDVSSGGKSKPADGKAADGKGAQSGRARSTGGKTGTGKTGGGTAGTRSGAGKGGGAQKKGARSGGSKTGQRDVRGRRGR